MKKISVLILLLTITCTRAQQINNERENMGTYQSMVADQFTWEYIRPQECGYKTDVRWFKLQSDNGKGLQIRCVMDKHLTLEVGK